MTTSQLIAQLLNPVQTSPMPTPAGGSGGEFLQLLNSLTPTALDGAAVPTVPTANAAAETAGPPSSPGKSLNVLLWAALAQLGRRPLQSDTPASSGGAPAGSAEASTPAPEALPTAKADLAETLAQVRTAIQTTIEQWRGQLPARLEAAHATVERAEALYTRLFEVIEQFPGEEAQGVAEAVGSLAESLGCFKEMLAALLERLPADESTPETPPAEQADDTSSPTSRLGEFLSAIQTAFEGWRAQMPARLQAAQARTQQATEFFTRLFETVDRVPGDDAEGVAEAIGGVAETLDRFQQVLAVLAEFFPAGDATAEQSVGKNAGTVASALAHTDIEAPNTPALVQRPTQPAKSQLVTRQEIAPSGIAPTQETAEPLAADEVREVKVRADKAIDELARAVERVARAAHKQATVTPTKVHATPPSAEASSPTRQTPDSAPPADRPAPPVVKVEPSAAIQPAAARRPIRENDPNVSEIAEIAAGGRGDADLAPAPGPSLRATAGAADPAKVHAGSAIRTSDVHAPEEIVRHAVMMVRAGRSEMSVRLDPPELGTLRLVVRQVNDQTQVLLRVESAAAHEFIREHVGQLRNGFGDNGLGQVRVQVDLVPGSSPGQWAQSGLWHGGTSQQSYHAPSDAPAVVAEPAPAETAAMTETVQASETSLVDLLV